MSKLVMEPVDVSEAVEESELEFTYVDKKKKNITFCDGENKQNEGEWKNRPNATEHAPG